MNNDIDYKTVKKINKANWDDRVPIHYKSDDYCIKQMVADPSIISGVVDFDKTEIGEVRGKSLLHLQCHIGTDTLSWARLGAASVTGIDFSQKAIAAANRFSKECNTPGEFIISDLYQTPEILEGRQFDIVYTGIGAICWLPDIKKWAKVVNKCLKPGGTFYIRDAHPVLLSMEWNKSEGNEYVLTHPYFEAGGALMEEEETSYAGDGILKNKITYSYNHGLGETITALINEGLKIEFVNEHTFCDWQGIEQMEFRGGSWQLPEKDKQLVPLLFSIRAKK